VQQQQQAVAALLNVEELGEIKTLLKGKYEGERKAREQEPKNKNKAVTK
jgi:hypothetical protein